MSSLLSLFTVSPTQIQFYAFVLGAIEVVQLLRYFVLAHPFTDITRIFGDKPNSVDERTWYLMLVILAYVRLAFSARIFHPVLAKACALTHVAEIPVWIYLFVDNTLPLLDRDVRSVVDCVILGGIVVNGGIFWRHWEQVRDGELRSAAPSEEAAGTAARLSSARVSPPAPSPPKKRGSKKKA